ncbi:ATP-binding cassette domain-containing protein [Camelimonas abortus]|uniref:ATP-binding cassette domain-containing protein n=1 Tax=Camelimonas abortus TaxID=1017184 RepID=A0ABV7LFL7_9HYPH
MSADVLAIEGLSVGLAGRGHGRAAQALVEDVSLRVKRGRVLALVGPSGAGKSLAFGAALDVLPAGVRRLSGTATLDGAPVPFGTLRGRHVAAIMQNPRTAFNPMATMAGHAFETLRALGVPREERRGRILAAMAAAGLEGGEQALGLHAFRMSGGMLQRMMIAIALASGSPFLFADEPTTGLDLIVQREILDLLERLCAGRGLGVLLITHDMSVVARLADEVAVMDGGRIVETGSVHGVFRRPQSPAGRRLLQAHMALYGVAEVS